MPKSKICLLDVNVWLALASGRHIHHDIAKDWFAQLGLAEAAFCRITQMSFLPLITNDHVIGCEAVSQPKAWTLYEDLGRDERVTFVAEPGELEAAWKRYTQGSFTGTNVWTDAYLAALAAVRGMTLVSFDRGVARIKDASTLILRG
jgi:toxin-antitoxin system PIN domain toxin